MTKDELLKLEPGTLVDVSDFGIEYGIFRYSEVKNISGTDLCVVSPIDFDRDHGAPYYFRIGAVRLHVPQPQVSGTIETKRKGLCDNTPKLHVCCMEKDPLHNVAKCSCGASALLYPHLKNTVPAKVTSIDDEKLVLHPKEETPPKLYTFSMGNATPATEDQIMAQECVKNAAQLEDDAKIYWKEKSEDFSKRLETAHEQERRLGDSNLRMAQRLAELEAPPTDADIARAYNTLIVAGYKDQAQVLQTLSRVVDRLSEELSARDGGQN